jgi:hypothetical protein
VLAEMMSVFAAVKIAMIDTMEAPVQSISARSVAARIAMPPQKLAMHQPENATTYFVLRTASDCSTMKYPIQIG